MTIEYITRAAGQLKRKYAEEDPFRLAQAMNILLLPYSLGKDSQSLKGFFAVWCRKPVIVYNDDLPLQLQRIIIMHEIAHSILHREEAAVKYFHNFRIFDILSQTEYEANIFTAEHLLDDAAVLTCIKNGMNASQIARELCVPPELLNFKLKIMKVRKLLPSYFQIDTRSSFLKDI